MKLKLAKNVNDISQGHRGVNDKNVILENFKSNLIDLTKVFHIVISFIHKFSFR